MPRKPCVSGQFYPDNEEELTKSITDSFASSFGPGSLPTIDRQKNILGAIVPHAGYMFSGPAAAHVFKQIAESIMPDLYVILGLSHNVYPSCVSLEDWETPLGTVKNDPMFGRIFMANSGLKQNEKTNQFEHSIEVELPFLQFVNKDSIEKLRFFPITISHDKDPLEIAKALVKTAEQARKRIIVIASSDFTHFGVNYGYFPFNKNIKDRMYELDKGAIDQITALNLDGFSKYVEKTHATICGRHPIEAMICYAKLMNAKSAELLAYYTSGDIVGDYSSAVGYGAIVFR